MRRSSATDRSKVRHREKPEKGVAAFASVRALRSRTAKEKAYTALRLKLAVGLRMRRKDHGLTQVALAVSIKSSQPRVAKMEAGDPTVSLDLLVRSLLTLGVSNRDLAALISGS